MTNLLRLIFKIIKAQCKANMSLLFSFSWHITIHWLFLKLFWVSIICQKISGSVFHFYCLYFYYSLTFLSLPNNEKISTWKVKTHLTNWIILLLSPCLGLKNTIILIRTLLSNALLNLCSFRDLLNEHCVRLKVFGATQLRCCCFSNPSNIQEVCIMNQPI